MTIGRQLPEIRFFHSESALRYQVSHSKAFALQLYLDHTQALLGPVQTQRNVNVT